MRCLTQALSRVTGSYMSTEHKRDALAQRSGTEPFSGRTKVGSALSDPGWDTGPMRAAGGSSDPRYRLRELRTVTVQRAASLEASFDGIVAAASDVATDDEHDPEGHTIAWERQQIAALLNESRSALAEIDAAVQRLDDGHYGTCTSCGRSIAAARLDALPATPTCVTCAR